MYIYSGISRILFDSYGPALLRFLLSPRLINLILPLTLLRRYTHIKPLKS